MCLKNVERSLADVKINNKVLVDTPNVLKDLKNHKFFEEDVKVKCWNYRKKNEIARERWKMLAKALLKPRKTSSKSVKIKDISVRRFTSFELITPNKLGEYWLMLDVSLHDFDLGLIFLYEKLQFTWFASIALLWKAHYRIFLLNIFELKSKNGGQFTPIRCANFKKKREFLIESHLLCIFALQIFSLNSKKDGSVYCVN